MNSQPGRLLRRSPLHWGESLPSLLARLTQLNHYEALSSVYQLCSIDPLPSEHAICPTRPDIFAVVADRTGLDPLELYASTAHRFAHCLTRPENPLETWTLLNRETVPCLRPEDLAGQIRPMFAAQFCPLCLQQRAYHRLTWLPIACAACLEHHCLLVDRCPVCQSFVSIQAIVQTHCSHCQADLRRARSISTAQDSIGMLAQRTLRAWLMNERSPEVDTLGLPCVGSSALLYRLMKDLRGHSLQAGATWKYLHRLPGVSRRSSVARLEIGCLSPPDQNYRLTATAFKALLNWPKNFGDFWDAYRRHDRLIDKPAFPLDLRDLYARWSHRQWRQPIFQFVRLAFEEYLITRYPETAFSLTAHQHHQRPIRSEQFAWIAIAEAAELLQTSPELILRLVSLGRLLPLRSTTYHGVSYDFVRRVEVLALRGQWPEPLSLNEAAGWLGLSLDVVRALLNLSQLATTTTVKNLAGRISQQAVTDLWSRLMSQAEFFVKDATELIELRWAMDGRSPAQIAALLDRVLAGDVRVYHPRSSSGGLDELQFAKQDLEEAVQFETRGAE